MAISYDFEMAASLPALQVAERLLRAARTAGLLDASATPEELLEQGLRTTRGTSVQVFEEHPEPWNPVVGDLGFTPTLSVTFRLGKSTGFPAQQDDIVVLVDALLATVTGDAVLEFQSEDIWLLRRGGDLTLNERDDLWPPQRLALLNQPHRRATYTFTDDGV